VWPLVIVTLVFIYRREIPRLIQALGGRMSKLSAVGVTLERIVQSLVSPLDLSQSGQVENFVQRFLQTQASGGRTRTRHREWSPMQTGSKLATWTSTHAGSRTNVCFVALNLLGWVIVKDDQQKYETDKCSNRE
jgi:hypothetical protein